MEEIRAGTDPAHVAYPGGGRIGQGRAAVPVPRGQAGMGFSVLRTGGRTTATAAAAAAAGPAVQAHHG